MSLRFIYGRSGSGKTFFCLNEIRRKIEKGAQQPLVLLVPEQYTFQAEKDLVRALQRGGILQTEVLSFRRMAFRIFSEVGGMTYPHIHAAGKSMIIYRLLDSLRKELRVFGKANSRQGFVRALAGLITELKQYDISPEELRTAARRLEEEHPFKRKLDEVIRIYAGYEETIAKRYRDIDDDLTLAAAKFSLSTLYDQAEIWLDGFDGFTTQEYKLIAGMLTKAERVNISLGIDGPGAIKEREEAAAGNDVFYPVKATMKRLIRLAGEKGILIEPPVLLSAGQDKRFRQSPELFHLEQNLFAYPCQIFRASTEDIFLYASPNIYSEVEATARDIVVLCRDKGLRYCDIAVLAGNLEMYERLIEVIFAQYKIPCFLDRKVEISNHPLVRLILAMLDIFNENWSYEAVFRYLKTGLTGIDRERIDCLENYVLACGIRGSSSWTKQTEWNMRPGLLPEEKENERNEEMIREINLVRWEIIQPLLSFQGEVAGRKKAAEICTALYDFLFNLGIPSRMEMFINLFREQGQNDLANEYAQVWNIVMDVFDQAAEVMGEEMLGLESFTNILKTGFGEYKVGIIPASIDQVLVGSPERSKSHEVKALFMLGVNDGVFPSASLSEGIFSDAERTALRKANIELAGDTRTKAFDEEYLIYRTLTMPGKFLRLSWPMADQEGKALRPSLIVSRLKQIFPEIAKSDSTGPSNDMGIDRITSPSPAFRQMVLELRKAAAGQPIDPLWQAAYHWFSTNDHWLAQCAAMRTALNYRNIARPVSKLYLDALYGNPVYAGVSRLEKYSSCPFAFYMQYGLGAGERQVYRLSPPDTGTFLHAVIEKFSDLIAANNLSWRDLDRDWCEESVSILVDEMLEGMKGSGFAGSKRYTVLAKRLKRVVARAVRLIAEHICRGGFEPLGYEIGFGSQEEFPPIMIELPSGEKINLIGRIDRVDAWPGEAGTFLRIVDYKSGNKDFKLSDVYYGLQLQLITYLDALLANEAIFGRENGLAYEPPLLPAGVLYFRLDDPLIRRNGPIREEEIEKLIMKRLRMKGLLLADVKLIKEMDREITGSSSIIPAALNKDDTLGKLSKTASLTQFNSLCRYVRNLLGSLAQEMLNGNVAISPYKNKGGTSCQYCSYRPVCQFDAALPENSYRMFAERTDQEIWRMIDGAGG